MASSVALVLAKSESKRLPNKNTLPVNNTQMFLVNVAKCLDIFDSVYVSSDSIEILEDAMKAGAIPIKRGKELCGDTPNIKVYQHALKHIKEDIIIAVQANSPTIEPSIISLVKTIMESGVSEVMTCHKNYKIYGSVWGLTRDKIKNYDNPYKPRPDVLVLDNSIDVHTQKDYTNVIKYYEKNSPNSRNRTQR